MARVSFKELLKAGVHYGHRTSRWNPKMKPFVFGKRNGIHIINLRTTVLGIVKAKRFLADMVALGEAILFVGTKRQAAPVVREEAGGRGLPYVADRWLGGMLTNFQTVRRSLGRLEQLEQLEETGEINSYSKKMISTLQREKRRILRNLQGVRTLDRLPGALVIIDPRRDRIALQEAIKLGIPTVGLLDTDCDPSLVSIAVPCNDDSIRSISVVLRHLVEAVEEAVALQEAGGALPEAVSREIAAAAAAPAAAPEPPPTPAPAAAPAPEAEPTPSGEGTAPAAPQP